MLYTLNFKFTAFLNIGSEIFQYKKKITVGTTLNKITLLK